MPVVSLALFHSLYPHSETHTMTVMTIDQLKVALPGQFKKGVSTELLDVINNSIADPEASEIYRDNLVCYASVMQQGKFKITSYLDAVRYVTFKLMNYTNIKAYSSAFPDKIDRFNKQGVSGKDVASYVHAYSTSKLVTLILGQSLTPTWIVNQDLYQQALNTQAELSIGAKSEKVRSDAANSLIVALKRPETQKVELDIGIREDKTIEALRASTLELVAQQKLAIQSGASQATDIAHSKLITDASYQEVVDDEPEEESAGQPASVGGILFK